MNYGKTSFTLQDNTLQDNTLQDQVLTGYTGEFAAWDFSTVASGIQVNAVSQSPVAFDYREVTPGDISYNAWAEEAGVSHSNPARLTGGTFADSGIVEVYGHSLYITGSETQFQANSENFSFRIGCAGSSFDSLVDRVVISDGARLISNGRVQIGMYGDGEILVTNASIRSFSHFMVGDSRLVHGIGNGRAVFDNSIVESEGTLTVGYCANGEMIVQNESILTFSGGLNVVERNSYASPLFGMLKIQEGSSLRVLTHFRIGYANNSTGIVNLDNGSMVGWNYLTPATLGVNPGAYGELNIGNGSTFTNTNRALILGNVAEAVGVMQVIGGENTIMTGTLSIRDNSSTLNFLADNTGLSSITATGEVSLNGNVQAGLAGGMVAMAANRYPLISGASRLSGIPTDNNGLWQLSSEDNVLTATLNPELEWIDRPLNQGWIFLKDTSGAIDPSTISARLVLSGLLPGEIDNFIEWLNSSDYLGDHADVTIDLLHAELDEESENTILVSPFWNELGEAYFAFDFSGFDSDVLLASVTLDGQAAVPEPATCILLLLGTLWIIREKRRRMER